MNIFEAFKALDAGKAVRNGDDDKVFYAFVTNHFPNHQVIDYMEVSEFNKGEGAYGYLGQISFQRKEIESNNWHVYERP